MVMDRELVGDELLQQSATTRAQAMAVIDRLNFFLTELQREFDLDDDVDQEP
jgi:hypothetical protein